jgi:hypothetical protein
MVLVPFRAVSVGVYAESDISATAENTAGTDYLVMVPEYHGYPGIGTLVAANSFLAMRNHKIANQTSREGGMPQPCFQWPETAEMKQQEASVHSHGASTSAGFAIVLDVFGELSPSEVANIPVLMLVNLTVWGNEFPKNNALTAIYIYIYIYM